MWGGGGGREREGDSLDRESLCNWGTSCSKVVREEGGRERGVDLTFSLSNAGIAAPRG